MHKLNWIFTLSSIDVLLVTIERFSFTTKIVLQPYSFLRLHELLQMITLILFTVILPLFLLKEVTSNFKTIQQKKGFLLFLAFIIGVYFYATGNGLHEVSSFNFNQYCNVKNFSGDLCGGFFFNDFYTGNIFYFIGGGLMVVAIMLLEEIKSFTTFTKKDMTIAMINAVVYAFAIFAYAAFDRVLVGLIYSIIITVIADYLYLKIRAQQASYPVTTYTAATYTLGTIAAILVKFIR